MFGKKAGSTKNTQGDDNNISEDVPKRPVSTLGVAKEFKPTEQQAYAETLFTGISEGVIKVEASAGSGKSTTLHHLGTKDRRPTLGLVFSKDMAAESREKSTAKGNAHVEWRSTHSLAYGKFGMKYQHKLKRPQGRYVNVAGTGSEIAKYFRIPDFYLDSDVFISKAFIGLIIKDTVNRFEVSSDFELKKDKHLAFHHLKDLKKRYGDMFPADKFGNLIYRRALDLWEERIDVYSDVLINHNTYLKLYHLSKPELWRDYSVIYVDEAQDLNPVTLDIIEMQKGKSKIVLVGDTYQSIFQFNGAVNAMSSVKTDNCAPLTKSFRFGKKIADIATAILQEEMVVEGLDSIDSVAGLDSGVDYDKPYTMLFRGNMELIFTAAKYISEGKDVQVYVDLKDFVNSVNSAKELYEGNLNKVKSEKIIPFSTWDELKEEAKSDPELGRLVKIVEADEADSIVKKLKSHKNDTKAHITMMSAHKSKGLERSQILLANDFPSNYNQKGEWVGLCDQERNLLYVAATRAMHGLQYNKTVQELIDVSPLREVIEKY
ncbi:hypothetical protein KUA24_66 [Vibrio phage HNL01]|nr:hypothetical protein KUA24_66 [Vibrio phage HNL01]